MTVALSYDNFSLLAAAQGSDSLLGRAVGGDWKGKASPVLYLTAIIASFR